MTMAGKFTEFEVTRVVTESEIISSFYLKPKSPLQQNFIPGEYLLFEHTNNGADPIRREYSISGKDENGIRITIKHEKAPTTNLPDGVMSSRFHTAVKVGDVVLAAGPMGQFILDRDSSRPVVLLSGGVGLTPMVAMAHELATQSQRDTHFIHACENGSVHAMGKEMRALADSYPHLKTHFIYREPEVSDRAGIDYDSTGFVTRALMDSLLPSTDSDIYLCGPGPFMQAIYDLLHDKGVETDQIAYEFFGPASVLKPKNGTKPLVAKAPAASTEQPKIRFAKSNVDAHWDPGLDSLLEFAEEQGVMVDFSCRAGTCDTCKTKVLSGSVNYPIEPFERPSEGYALLCCSVPNSDVELDA